MIVEGLVGLFLNTLRAAFGALEIINLPMDLIGALGKFVVYGNWVVGVDLLAIFAASVVFWWTFHMSIGLIVWVWEKLPLT